MNTELTSVVSKIIQDSTIVLIFNFETQFICSDFTYE
jgi:hypothetical protein